MAWEYGKRIWDKLMSVVGNEYGVSGLMGNLLSESGLLPYRLQGDFEEGHPSSLEYTSKVDNGIVSEYDFVNNAPNGGGYGLAQWTYYTRKQALYNMKQEMNVSIGDIELALKYLIYELNNTYPTVLSTIKNATSIRQASDTVLHDFENPADQSESVEIYRASLGSGIYEVYVGTTPDPDPDDPTPVDPPTTKKMKLYLMMGKRRI